jgi:tRNA/tmRNA/rRNA uracil-C5-methylase (TrmA/RlmC/RlmD family)
VEQIVSTGRVELLTTRMVAGGDALARAEDGRVALVDGALPGERVRVSITSDRADHLRAQVVEVLEAAPERIEPPCVHARNGCGGCGWQHVTVDAQRAYKRDIITDALRRIAHVEDAPLRDTIELPPTGYRTTVRALVVDGRAAFRRHHAHDAVLVDSCLVAHPLVEDMIRHGRFCGAREVTLRAGVGTGERCAYTDPKDAPIEVAADVRTGPRAHMHELVDGMQFRISARSFFQTRVDGAEALAHLVRDAVGADRVVADLYCGVGLFAGLVESPRQVFAVERDRHAFADARHNLRGRQARVVRGDVGTWRGEPVDVVIADPSRAGLGRAGVRTVFRCDAARVVLVSCDAAAFARDVALLRDGGYDLTTITPVDLFPHTPHVECVSILDREP